MNPLFQIPFLCCVLLAVSASEEPTKNVFNTAKDLGLTTFVEEIVNNSVANILSNSNGVTLLAPTNAVLDELLSHGKPTKDPQKIKEILKYYMLPGSHRFQSFSNEFMVYTLSTQFPYARVNLYHQGNPIVQVATIQCAPFDLSKVNQKASNGWVHTLNGLMIPPSGTIMQYLQDYNEEFSILISLLEATGFDAVMQAPGPYTIFAPKNEAFDKLTAGTLDTLRNDLPQLTGIIKLHIVAGTYCSAGITSSDLMTAEDLNITVTKTSGGITVQNANVVYHDGSVINGVVHHIDQVILSGNPAQ